MGLGLSGAYGAQGAQSALRLMEDRAIQDKLREAEAQQMQFENAIKLRQISEQEATGGVHRQDILNLIPIRTQDATIRQSAEGRNAREFDQKFNIIEGLTPMQKTMAFTDLKFGDLATPEQSRARAMAEGQAAGAGSLAEFDAGGRQVEEGVYGPQGIRTLGGLREIAARGFQDRLTQSQRPVAPPTSSTSPYQAERETRVLDSVDELMADVGPLTVGVGSLLSRLPATDARNFAAKLNTLKGNIAFSELTAMRAASKTGGALGAVSDKEIALLESSLGALDPQQSPAHFKAQLQKIRDSISRFRAAEAGGAPVGGRSAGAGSGNAPARPAGVPANAIWDASTRTWVIR